MTSAGIVWYNFMARKRVGPPRPRRRKAQIGLIEGPLSYFLPNGKQSNESMQGGVTSDMKQKLGKIFSILNIRSRLAFADQPIRIYRNRFR